MADVNVVLKNVRLSYPVLVHPKPSTFPGAPPDPRFSCALIFTPGSQEDLQVQAAVKDVLKMNEPEAVRQLQLQGHSEDSAAWALFETLDQSPKSCAYQRKPRINRKTFQVTPGYEGMHFLSCGSVQTRAPRLYSSATQEITTPEGQRVARPIEFTDKELASRTLYGGRFVAAQVQIWYQKGQRAIRCQVMAVRDLGHGESFGSFTTIDEDALGSVQAATPDVAFGTTADPYYGDVL